MAIMQTAERTDWETGTDEDAEYRAFVDSVTVTGEEMAVLISTPNLGSIEEAKRYLRAAREANPPGWPESATHHREPAIARAYRRLASFFSNFHPWNHSHHHG